MSSPLPPALLVILTVPGLCLLLSTPSSGQVIPDRSLGSENSVVQPAVINGLPSDRIEGGASRGSHLFHSFQDFNVGENRGVYFANPTGIEHILSRVTGANCSHILGTLGVLGTANLFLINPNGIVFGPNARLDVAGSFVGSTANSVVFDNFDFSASNPAPPPLLAINIPIGLRFRDNPAPILVQSRSPGLAIQPDQTLALVGGDLTFDRAQLSATVAQIELASIAANEQVGLDFSDNFLALAPTTVQQFRDTQLLQGSTITITAGGNINLYSRNLTLLGDSKIDANALGEETGGSINLQLTERLTMVGGNIAAQVAAGATGSGGDITIAARELRLSEGAQVNVDTFGQGNAGNLTVTADRITAIGEDGGGFPSGLFASVQSGATGQGGSLDITTGDLTLLDGAQMFADTFGDGDAGSLVVRAARSITLDGMAADGSTSTLSASVNAEATGNGGDLILTTPQLTLSNGGLISVDTFGQGESGNLSVIADRITIAGTTPDGTTASGLYAQVNPGGIGNGGNLDITTQQLQISQGGQISVSTFGIGNGGNLTLQAQTIDLQDSPSGLYAQVNAEARGQAGLMTIATDRLRIANGATIAASTAGEGDAGSIAITANDVEISGRGSFLGAQVNTGATGRGGDTTLTTQRLVLRDGGRISADTFAQGDAGNLVINASDRVQVDGIDTFLTADVGAEATGTGGKLEITTNRLEITGGGIVGAGTFGQGNAGRVLIRATDAVIVRDRVQNGENLSSSRLRARVGAEATGTGGSLQIETRRLLITDGAEVTASTFGRGNAGSLQVIATDGVEIAGDGSFLGAQVNPAATGNGGDTLIQTPRLFLRNGGRISADTFGFGDAGNLTILSDYLEVAGANTFLTAEVNAAATGTGGNLLIQTGRLEVKDGARIGASTFGQGDAGFVQIEASDAIVLQGQVPDGVSSRITAEVRDEATGAGGDLLITTPRLQLRDGAQISAGTFAAGDAGNLVVQAGEIDLQGNSANARTSSGLYAQVERNATGAGGNLLIEADHLRAKDGGQVSVATFGAGDAGNLVIVADRIDLQGETSDGSTPSGLFATVESGAIGNGGNLALQTRQLTLRDGARISVSTAGAGNAGSLTIEATESMQVLGEAVDGTVSVVTAQVDTGATGRGGDLTIVTPLLQVRDGAQISASTKGEGDAGNLLVAAETVELTGKNSTGFAPSALLARVETGATGEGGNLAVVGDRLRLTGGAQIGVDTFGEGNGGNLAILAQQAIALADSSLITASVQADALGDAGNLSVETDRLTLNSGAQILAATFGFGNAGNVEVEARDHIRLAGQSPDGLPTGLFATVEPSGLGTAGSLTARTGSLRVEDGAQISVSDTSGFSSAGDLRITADSIRLNRNASLRAETSAGSQGNITLQAQDIQLRRHSNITTNAIGTATGGNIAIATGVLAALENSDITANAQESFGGRVIINAQGIFGTEFRTQATPASDITATSALGPAFSGIVEIQTPEIDPSQGLVELPENVVDPAALIAANACVQGQDSEFVITGRGGLPPTPQEPLAQGEAPLTWIEPVTPRSPRVSPGESTGGNRAELAPRRHEGTKTRRTEHPAIVPAQGWVVTDRGEILLVANQEDINIPTPITPPPAHRIAPQSAACPPPR